MKGKWRKMGLFGKSVCIAFVGAEENGDVEKMQLVKYEESFHNNVMQGAENVCPGIPVLTVFFKEWTSSTYSRDILLNVQRNGFTPYDEDKKRQLMKEMDCWLIGNLGIWPIKAKPQSVYEFTTIFGDGFIVYWKYTVKSQNLKEYQKSQYDFIEDAIKIFKSK